MSKRKELPTDETKKTVENNKKQADAPGKKEAATPQLPPPNDAKLPVAGGHGGAVKVAVPPVPFPKFERERRNFWGRVLLLLALLAVLAGAVLIFLFRPGAYTERVNSVKFYYDAESDLTTVSFNGEPLEGDFDGECTAYAYDGKGAKCAALIGGDLYLINRKEVSLLCEDVRDFCLAQNGKAIAYRNAEHELIYQILTGKRKTSVITKSCTLPDYCLSPNGKELFYTYEQEGVCYADLYSRTNSKPNFAKTAGLVPIAVGDKCHVLYYKDAENTLYYMEGKKDTPPVKCFESAAPYTLLFNRDFSEVLIDGALGTQLWQDGERVTIPELAAGERLVYQANQRAAYRVLSGGGQYLVKTFEKSYYLHEGKEGDGVELMYLGRKGDLSLVTRVIPEESCVTVTDKGVYYLEVEKKPEETQKILWRCKLGKTEAERVSWENISEICFNSDGSRFLYVTKQGALYSMAVSREVPDRLADYIDEGTLCATAGDAFYYTVDGTLFVSDNGKTPREIGKADALFTDGYTAYFVEIGEDGTLDVRANHRNRRRDTEVAGAITDIR